MRRFQILNDAIAAEVLFNQFLLKSATQTARINSHTAILAYGRNHQFQRASKSPAGQAIIQMAATPLT